jgi:hypothetical protein
MKEKLLIIRNAYELTLASYPLVLRDDCMDAEGRATQGSVAERVRDGIVKLFHACY